MIGISATVCLFAVSLELQVMAAKPLRSLVVSTMVSLRQTKLAQAVYGSTLHRRHSSQLLF